MTLNSMVKDYCDDCEDAEATSFYVGGMNRCGDCAENFNEHNRMRAVFLGAKPAKPHDCETSDEACEECCSHGDVDSHCCLDCGKDLTEDRFAKAFDMAKAARQDG